MATENKQSDSKFRTTIEAAFFANNVKEIKTLKEAYQKAVQSPGTIVTDQTVHEAEKIGLDPQSKVLIFNDGAVTGRYKDARVILDRDSENTERYSAILRDELYHSRKNHYYSTSVYIGLDKAFMLKAHLLMPEGSENTLYNWMLNFQHIDEKYNLMYEKSTLMDEEDILIYSNPDWFHPDHPLGLAIFDPESNCAAILGMKYFGEHKKGTLTLAWNAGRKQGYIPCHGGLKEYEMNKNQKVIMAFFGLSGSGKSTLTHYHHEGKYGTRILHDDAFLISSHSRISIALEPSYFDKTQDYPANCPDNKYLLTLQNCGARKNNEGKIVPVTEDIRNTNGRAIKSKLWKANRVDKFDLPIDSIVWISKDPALPPILKITDPILASTFGATLATKRSTAEKLKQGIDPNALVIEPYANPFRVYPLIHDYEEFKSLFSNGQVACYIINTGSFMDKDISKDITIEAIEKTIEDKGDYQPFGKFSGVAYLPIEGYLPDFLDQNYCNLLFNNINIRINYLKNLVIKDKGLNALPDETIEALTQLANALA